MIAYLIKSALCLVILLGIYHLLLEKEKMHRFNRFFLLFSLAFGLVVPLISLDLILPHLQTSELSTVKKTLDQPFNLSKQIIGGDQNNGDVGVNYWQIGLALYMAVAGLLAIRFIANLALISRKVLNNRKLETAHSTIVLIKEQVVPHSFLNYTFFNEQDYLQNNIAKQILTHEFAHVRQKHSLDILAIEVLKITFWFNPVFLLYKRAIQLNHEYLADESVIHTSPDISSYQQVLLQSASLKTITLASNLNFAMTKKRLIMMSRQTSKRIIMVKETILLPLLIALIVVFAGQSVAEQPSAFATVKRQVDNRNQASKDTYFKGGIIEFKNADGLVVRKKYEEMTKAEKSILKAPAQPTQAMLNTWLDTTKYRISIDLELVQNKDLSKHKNSDFTSYITDKLKDTDQTMITLLTPQFFELFKNWGGMFMQMDGKERLRLPPPVVTPPSGKKN